MFKIDELVKASDGRLLSKEVIKNGEDLLGIYLNNSDGEKTLSAIIYEDSVEQLTENCDTIESAVQTVYDFLMEHTERQSSIKPLTDIFNNAKDLYERIQIRAISADKSNGDILPVKTEDGISYYYQIFFDIDDGASALLPNRTIEKIKAELDITDEDIWEKAVFNTEVASCIEDNVMGLPMTVSTNAQKYYGAAAIFVSQSFRDEAVEKVGGSFYVVPSSVHECILLPDGETTVEQIKEVHKMVQCGMEDKDILTSNIFHCAEDGTLTMVA